MVDNQTTQESPIILYHYCSVPTFYKIIKNRCIWLSDINKSNDSEELLWYMQIFDQTIKKVWNSFVYERQRAGKQDDTVEMQELYSEIDGTLQAQLWKSWAFCLSEKGDDLSQWRGYANDATGLAIGFDTRYFYAINWSQHQNSTFLNPDSANNPHFGAVIYGQEARKQLMEEVEEALALAFVTSETTPGSFATMLLDIIKRAKFVSPFFKNDSFEAEKEWRLVFSMSYDDILHGELESYRSVPNNNPFYLKDYGYTEKESDLVSHIEFSSSSFEKSISEILIGPKCNLTEAEIKLFLVSSGFFPHIDLCNIKIRKSVSSYR